MMMKKIIQNLPVVFIFLLSCNQGVREVGNGNMETKKIDVDNFDEVSVYGNYSIFLEQSDQPGLTLTADENLMKYIEASVNGSKLEIESTKNIKSDEGLELYITYKELKELEVGGASSIENEGILRGKSFNLDMSGAGSVEMNVELEQLSLTISGAGSVKFKGVVEEQDIDMSGAGEYGAEDLRSQICKISISGVGGADVNVEQKLVGEVSGVGGITYFGNPPDVQTNVSGLGNIEKAE